MTARRYTYFKEKIHQINKVLDADEEEREVRDLRAINTTLRDAQKDFVTAIKEISALAEFCDDSLSEQDFVVEGKNAIPKIQEKFAKNGSAQSVKADRHFVKLQEAAGKAVTTKDRTFNRVKSDFERTHLSNCETPIVLKSRLVMTEANRKAFSKYENAFNEFKNEMEKLGVYEFKNAASKLKARSEVVKSVFSTFETNYPDFVNEFLNAFQKNQKKISLSSLTIEQLQWLKANKLAERYMISPEAND